MNVVGNIIKAIQSQYALGVWERALARGFDALKHPIHAITEVTLNEWFSIKAEAGAILYYAGGIPFRAGSKSFKLPYPGIICVTERNVVGGFYRRVYVCGLGLNIPEFLKIPLEVTHAEAPPETASPPTADMPIPASAELVPA